MNKQNPANVFIYAITISIIGFALFVLFDSLGLWFIVILVIVFLALFSFFIYTVKSIQKNTINKSEIKKCMNCQSEMESNTKICPNCGADQIE